MLIKLPTLEHEKDPADLLREQLGDLSKIISIRPVDVLVATYIRPEKTAGGIYLDPKIQREDLYQGKVGLIVKMGTAAFQDDDYTKFKGYQLKVGDWVMYMPNESRALSVNGCHCRLIEDKWILGNVKDPDVVL